MKKAGRGKIRGKRLKTDMKKALKPLWFKAFSLAEKEGFEANIKP